MTPRPALFCTGIHVKNFRGYGKFDLELPAWPCVVVLSGPNGLGKTSLFEAVEWSLTGSVKRLHHVCGGKTSARDLARHASGVESFDVALTFRDANRVEERVSRTQFVPASTESVPAQLGTSIEEVASILGSGDPRWNVSGTNLADYLHLTHLHAQVAFLRLVTFDAKERWVRVSPLAGVDRFERVRTNLTNSKKELTALQKRRTQEHGNAVARREQWEARLARLDQLQKVAAAVQDLVSPPEVLKSVRVLRSGLKLNPSTDEHHDGDLGVASDHVRQLRVDSETERIAVKRRIDALAPLRALPQQVADARKQHTTLDSRSTVLAVEVDKLKSLVEALEASTRRHRDAFDEAVKHQRIAAERHEVVVRAERDRADLLPLEQELVSAEDELKRSKQREEELELELARSRGALTSYESLLRELETTREQLASADRSLSALTEIETLEKRLRAEVATRDEIVTRLRNLEADIETATAEQRARDDAARAISREIDTRQQAFDALQRALLTIVEHVSDEDTECPVCHTHFDPGLLRDVAQRVVVGTDPKLAEADDSLRMVRAGLEHLRREQAARELDRRKLEADVRVVNENLAQLQSRVGALRKEADLEARPNEQARVELTRQRTALLEDEVRIERGLTSAAAHDIKQVALDAVAAVEAQARLHRALHETRNARQTRVEELRARVLQTQREHPDLGRDAQSLGLLSQARAADASTARSAADAASLRVTEAQAAENATRHTLASTESELSEVVAQIDALSEAVAAYEARWRDAGVPEPITARSLDGLLENLALRDDEMRDGLSAIQRLGAALDHWRQAQEIRALETEIRSECASGDHGAYALELDQAVEAAALALTIARRAREAADELSATLNKVTAEFNGAALRPFDELFRRYLRALIHDERFHTITATYKPAARSAGLSFRVDLGGIDTEAEYILSEGQLGEVSLATMLAASTAFPWSRWRVLLLDDPSQYNDLIHSTALFDVLRNLVRFAGYQIFISTHDNDQASFLRRKLDAIEAPWIDCRYIGHSTEGIVAEVQRSFDTGLEGTALGA